MPLREGRNQIRNTVLSGGHLKSMRCLAAMECVLGESLEWVGWGSGEGRQNCNGKSCELDSDVEAVGGAVDRDLGLGALLYGVIDSGLIRVPPGAGPGRRLWTAELPREIALCYLKHHGRESQLK